jgi:predicted tellurium resistance membrane protein TerC
MFAIMGLRSLYTILSKAASELKYLEPAVAIVLGFIGVKMVAEFFGILVPTELSLGVVLTLLSGGVGLSIYDKEEEIVEAVEEIKNVVEQEPVEQEQTTSRSSSRTGRGGDK